MSRVRVRYSDRTDDEDVALALKLAAWGTLGIVAIAAILGWLAH